MIKNYEELEEQLKEYAINYATLAKKEAEMNERINKIKEDFEEKTKELRYITDVISSEINAFCEKNKADFEKNKKQRISIWYYWI